MRREAKDTINLFVRNLPLHPTRKRRTEAKKRRNLRRRIISRLKTIKAKDVKNNSLRTFCPEKWIKKNPIRLFSFMTKSKKEYSLNLWLISSPNSSLKDKKISCMQEYPAYIMVKPKRGCRKTAFLRKNHNFRLA